MLNEETLNYLVSDYEPIQNTIKAGKTTFLSYYSEYKKDNKVFRAHSNYKKEGAWNDWVMIRWKRDGNFKQKKEELKECHVIHPNADQKSKGKFLYSPGQIQCFISPKQGVYHAIVKCCNYKFSKGSVFSTKWKQEYIYHKSQKKVPRICHINVDAIVGHAVMIPSDKKKGTYHQIWERCYWVTNSIKANNAYYYIFNQIYLPYVI